MKIINHPKVSIIIPVYNGSNFMRDAIDSALSQTYENIEIIVVNDGSNDNGVTEEIAKSYGSSIRYFNKNNGGVATALNLGIEKMTGEYFSWLSHDDIYYPNKIAEQVSKLEESRNDYVIISDWTIIGKGGRVIKQCVLDDRLERAPMCFLAFDTDTWLNACAMLIPVSAIKKCGGFDESLRTTQDYDMHRKLIKSGVKFKILHKPLLYSRTHSGQGCVVEATARESSDLIHQKIIKDIPAGEIAKYFNGDYQSYLDVYKAYEANGYRGAIAYFVDAIMSDLISGKKKDLAATLAKLLLVGDNVPGLDIGIFMDKHRSGKDRKRIMFCSGHWLTGGMERVLSNIFPELRDYYDIFLLTPFDGRKSCIKIPEYVTHIKISNDLFNKQFDIVGLSYALMLDIDVVIGFMNMHDGQLDLYRLCKAADIKTIASSHEHYMYPYKNPAHYGIIQKRLEVLRGVGAAIWPTNFSVAVYSQYNNNGYVIANPNAVRNIEVVHSNHNSVKNILCVGRFNDYVKRVDRALKCFAEVLKTEPSANLIFVGKNDNNANIGFENGLSVNDLIKKLKISQERINFVGEVNNVDDYYQQASLILLTSDSEGFGMVLVEAARHGVPAVCNSITGIEDLITDGENGYIVEQDDIIGLSERVCRILKDSDLRNMLGQRATELAKRFNPNVIGENWRYLLDAVINEIDTISLKNKLDKRLSYVVSDYRVFCREMAIEFNEAFCIIASKKEPNVNGGWVKRSASRFVSLVQNEGFKPAVKRVIRKLHNRISN